VKRQHSGQRVHDVREVAHRYPSNRYHTLQLSLALQPRPHRTCKLAAAHGEIDRSVEASGKREDIYHFLPGTHVPPWEFRSVD